MDRLASAVFAVLPRSPVNARRQESSKTDPSQADGNERRRTTGQTRSGGCPQSVEASHARQEALAREAGLVVLRYDA